MQVRIRCQDGSKLIARASVALEFLLVLLGVVFLGAFFWLQFEQHYFGTRYLREFERNELALKSSRLGQLKSPPPESGFPQGHSQPSTIQGPPAAYGFAQARLSVPRIGLDVPVLEGVGDRELRRGAGWIPGTARPGESGNVGIAAHRDTFFRPLRNVRSGDRVELKTLTTDRYYVVHAVYVVDPDYVEPLEPTAASMLTLVTCFPFEYLGPAPRRYIVRAVEEVTSATYASQPLHKKASANDQ